MMPLWLFLTILITRGGLAVLGFFHPERFQLADSANYLALASNLWHHGVFSQSAQAPFAPELFRVPGYPLFLSLSTGLFAAPVSVAIAVQCLLSALTLSLFWSWARTLTTPARAAWATVALTLDPNLLVHSPMILAEGLYLLVVLIALWGTWRGLQDDRPFAWAARGLLWGLATLVRPVSLYLPLILAPVIGRSKRMAAGFLVGAYLLPLGWCARNAAVGGRWAFTSQSGIDLMRYTASSITALEQGIPLDAAQASLMGADNAVRDPANFTLNESQHFQHQAMAVIARHPFRLMRYCASGVARILFGSSLEMAFDVLGVPSQVPYPGYHPDVMGKSTMNLLKTHLWLIPLYFLYMAGLLALYVTFWIGAYRLWKDGRHREALLLAVSVLALTAFSSLLGHYRFRLPLMPFLLVGALFAKPPHR